MEAANATLVRRRQHHGIHTLVSAAPSFDFAHFSRLVKSLIRDFFSSVAMVICSYPVTFSSQVQL